MKWITIHPNLPSFRDLVQQALDYLRRDLITVVTLDGKKGKKIDRTIKRPWHLLPSIRGFRIELSPYDWLLELFDLKKRFPNKMEFKTWKNDSANAYIDYMFKRLNTLVRLEKYDEAVDCIWILMNSSAYQVSALNHVLSNWHRKLSFKQIKWVLKDVRKLVKSRATALKYARVYLHETHKIRPLGVPAISWRIYLHMYNNCLVEWRSLTESNKQHGYLPGKGVITAWFAIVKRLNQPNIYEADYKGFFNNVTHIGIYRQLEKMGFPSMEALFIWNINNSVVKLTNNDEIDEPHRAFTVNPNNPSEIWCGTTTYQLWTSFETGFIDLYEMGCFDDDVPMKGVPQGAPTSCSIATLALRGIEEKLDVIIYADDIIYFPSSSDVDPVKDLSDPDRGLIINEDKSRWIKKDGVWLVDSFKFLGIRYYVPKGLILNMNEWAGLLLQGLGLSYIHTPARFVAETRKGANLEFTNKESLLSYLAIARELLLDSKYLRKTVPKMSLTSWLLSREGRWSILSNKAKLLFGTVQVGPNSNIIKKQFIDIPDRVIEYKNPLTGYLLARMFSNSWVISTRQDFSLSYTSNSWVATQWKRYCWGEIIPENSINIFNSSSFACADLLNWLSRLNKSQQQIIRRVYSKSKPNSKAYSKLKSLQSQLREEFISKSLTSNYSAPSSVPKWSLGKRPFFVPELALIFALDIVFGFPLFTAIWTLIYLNSRKEYFEI